MFKKLINLSVIFSLVLLFVGGEFTVKAESGDCQCSKSGNLSIQEIREKLKAEGVEIIDSLSSRDRLYVDSLLDQKLKQYNNELEKFNYDEYSLLLNAEMYKGFKNVQINSVTYEQIAVKYVVLENKSTGELITQSAWVDLKSKDMIDLSVVHIDEDQNFSLIFDYKNYLVGNGMDYSANDFNFNGKSFACSLTGVFACISYCGIWHVVNPAVGVGCDILCGGAFAFACAGV
ncbi:putative immunity/bacteriocin fusion bifunctional protein [Paenibacillus sp. RRE4]|uniref:putative immunity/bacteriocin fusion bifunctional protein n=1 Tax=Paenibacillus sp. RRE4 TaxID=2962587 RepID=UPI002881944E|nr:putative immunity/bacteriocin fusion bifunctional protein [Paenibacillus sp. RRE4]MDT0124412.1 putative immunity/bacteriocin fusion bifunctional protein [Paenibacillus sp. RRE4]